MKSFYFSPLILLPLIFLFLFTNYSLAKNSLDPILEPPVNYLSTPPKLDGRLDQTLLSLPVRKFPVIQKSKKTNPDAEVTYRMAYGAEFFYVYVEAEANELTYRDRAFQNGDGFHFVLAKPLANNEPSEEFYVVACSAVNRDNMEWTRNIFWYYNVDTLFKRTGEATKSVSLAENGKISFEFILAWEDVPPFHPWSNNGIGFNMNFVKAIGEVDRNQYKILPVELGAENRPRDYIPLQFEKPVHSKSSISFLQLNRRNLDLKNKLEVDIFSVTSNASEELLDIKILNSNNEVLDQQIVDFPLQKGLSKKRIQLHPGFLEAGQYYVVWNSTTNSSSGKEKFTVLPEFNSKKISERIEAAKKTLSTSSYFSLRHHLEELTSKKNKLKYYETAGKFLLSLEDLIAKVEAAEAGSDVLLNIKGFVRKAYRSQLDNSLQPYMLYLPEDYSHKKPFPLLVYLHGSASNEMSLKAAKKLIPNDFIVLASNGRGPSNCYSWDDAQEDIAEAIQAVTTTYNIDEDNIFLTGFSMGGYGVYRTFYETPKKFKAMAIFSGHPNLANRWSGREDFPDFSKSEFLQAFEGREMFIFHGTEDLNCPFSTTEEIIGKLKNTGANVTFVPQKNKGHEFPGLEIIENFHTWIQQRVDE